MTYDNSHNDVREYRHYTAPDYTYEPTWIDREMSALQFIEYVENEESV